MKSPLLAAARNTSGQVTGRSTSFLGTVLGRSGLAAVSRAGGVALGAVVLFGCPIYSGSSGGQRGGSGNGDVINCDSSGNCCDESTGQCTATTCDATYECPTGAYCTNNGVCVSGVYDGGGYYYDGGVDSTTPGCSDSNPCQAGYTCTFSNRSAICVANGDGGTEASTGNGEGGTNPDGGSVDATPDTHAPFTGCTSNASCTADAGAGALCIDGQCVAAANQCFDSTQCPYIGTVQELCVQGVCTPSCASGGACPGGYACDTSTSACTVDSAPCGTADGGTACGTGTTCVDQHCVPTCSTAPDAGADAAANACGETGLVCVDYGCIPDQAATFFCGTEGQQDNCAPGSICLHHNCYIACTPSDAGGDAGSTCQHADNFNECKPVMTSTGTYDVCGSSTNLGNQCNPTQGQNCASPAICIDGYCR